MVGAGDENDLPAVRLQVVAGDVSFQLKRETRLSESRKGEPARAGGVGKGEAQGNPLETKKAVGPRGAEAEGQLRPEGGEEVPEPIGGERGGVLVGQAPQPGEQVQENRQQIHRPIQDPSGGTAEDAQPAPPLALKCLHRNVVEGPDRVDVPETVPESRLTVQDLLGAVPEALKEGLSRRPSEAVVVPRHRVEKRLEPRVADQGMLVGGGLPFHVQVPPAGKQAGIHGFSRSFSCAYVRRCFWASARA